MGSCHWYGESVNRPSASFVYRTGLPSLEFPPSPGTPEEGSGGGYRVSGEVSPPSLSPPPEYRERGKDFPIVLIPIDPGLLAMCRGRGR